MQENNKSTTEDRTKTDGATVALMAAESVAEENTVAKSNGTNGVKHDPETPKNPEPETTTDKSEKKAEEPAREAPKAKHPAHRAKQKKGGGGAIGFIALLVALGVGGAGYWGWEQLQLQLKAEQQKNAELRDTLESQVASAQGELTSLGSSLQSQVDTELANIQERQAAIETSLEQLYARIGNTSRDWVIAEADYLLQIANHRLQLARDVDTTLAALKLADQRIRSVGDPALIEVRETLAAEITSLETFSQPDIAGISLTLGTLADQVEQLPLRVRIQPEVKEEEIRAEAPVKADSLEALPGAMWKSIQSLITIRYNERPLEPLLPPEQVNYLYENIRLKLEQARLALLNSNQSVYNATMQQAIEWSRSFFDMNSETAQKFVARLESIAQTNIYPELPDISASLRVLRQVAKRIEFGLQPPKTSGE